MVAISVCRGEHAHAHEQKSGVKLRTQFDPLQLSRGRRLPQLQSQLSRLPNVSSSSCTAQQPPGRGCGSKIGFVPDFIIIVMAVSATFASRQVIAQVVVPRQDLGVANHIRWLLLTSCSTCIVLFSPLNNATRPDSSFLCEGSGNDSSTSGYPAVLVASSPGHVKERKTRSFTCMA